MSRLSEIFAGQGMRARYEPEPFELIRPDSFAERLKDSERELGLGPLEQPAEPPLEVKDKPEEAPKMVLYGDYRDQNLVVKAVPKGGVL